MGLWAVPPRPLRAVNTLGPLVGEGCGSGQRTIRVCKPSWTVVFQLFGGSRGIDHDGVSCQVLRSSRCGQTQMPPIRAGSDMSLGAGVEERALVAYNQALSPSCLRRTSLECLWT